MFKYKFDDLFTPLLKALHNIGGSATIGELEDEVARIMNLSDEELSEIHVGSRTKFSYRLAWARTYLKRYGLLNNSERGVWSLTEAGVRTSTVDKEAVKEYGRVWGKKEEVGGAEVKTVELEEELEEETAEMSWQEEMLDVLQGIPPDKFERVCQRMLRELGFINVEVTGRSGDGGIDGKGVLRLGGVLSFPVVFQCKRYRGSVSPSHVRDFRGSMIGRADKGLFFTTGYFSRDAVREAQRDGAPPIDLVDGYQFAETMRKLGLGIDIEKVEKVKVNEGWFGNV